MASNEIDTRKFAVLKAGASYSLPTYTVGENGLEEKGDAQIHFVKGNIDGPQFRQKGIITENLLSMLIEHLNTLNTGDLRNRNTSLAITDLESALMRIEERKRDRAKRNVLGTYKK